MQCRLVQRGRQVSAGEFVIIVIPLRLHGPGFRSSMPTWCADPPSELLRQRRSWYIPLRAQADPDAQMARIVDAAGLGWKAEVLS
jgi:hypothetical protein